MRTRIGAAVLAGLVGLCACSASSQQGTGVAPEGGEATMVGRRFEQAGQMDSAFAYYGRALEAQDTTRRAAMLRLLDGSPVVAPRRNLPAEVAFVRDVRALVAATPAGAASAARIETAEEAMAALEALLAHRQSRIEVRHPTRGFPVAYRRWLYRDDPSVLWSPLQSDTAVTVPAAAYQFRYRPAGAARDTIVTLPCANGCRVPPAP